MSPPSGHWRTGSVQDWGQKLCFVLGDIFIGIHGTKIPKTCIFTFSAVVQWGRDRRLCGSSVRAVYQRTQEKLPAI